MNANPDVDFIETADGTSAPSAYTHRLFKYRSLLGESREYTSRIVTRRHIYYAAAHEFNDPFDSRVSVNMDGAPLNEFGSSKRAELKAFAEKWFWEEMNKDLAVLSLTELHDNILMWSHYADGHRGICLDFTVRTSEDLHRVRYADVCPQF